ncbi:MAG: HU family DNA-binding protein [Sarcina sp.]
MIKRSELVRILSKKLGTSFVDTNKALGIIEDTIEECVVKEGGVHLKIARFEKIHVPSKHVREMPKRVPGTGEINGTIPEHDTVPYDKVTVKVKKSLRKIYE